MTHHHVIKYLFPFAIYTYICLLNRVLIKGGKTEIMWENIFFSLTRPPCASQGSRFYYLSREGLTYSHTDERIMLKYCLWDMIRSIFLHSDWFSIIHDICPFFSTNLIFGLIFLFTKVRKLWQKILDTTE